MGALQCHLQVLDKTQQRFSENSQVVSILGFSISIVATQLCLCSVKADTDKTHSEQVWLCSNEAIYKTNKQTNKQARDSDI